LKDGTDLTFKVCSKWPKVNLSREPKGSGAKLTFDSLKEGEVAIVIPVHSIVIDDDGEWLIVNSVDCQIFHAK
jgi:hypothetical protein